MAEATAQRRPRGWQEHTLGAGLILVALAAVEGAVRAKWVNPALIPRPSDVAVRVIEVVASGELLEPLVEVLRPLPKPALLPPLILFLGLGDAMKLAVIGLGVFFPVLINTVQGVRGVDPVLVDTGRTFRCGSTALLFRIVLPASMPLILAGMRVGLGLGLILVVIAEMLAGTGGVGYLIIDMQRSFRVRDMYAWIVILALLGYALNFVFLQIEKRIIHWALARPE